MTKYTKSNRKPFKLRPFVGSLSARTVGDSKWLGFSSLAVLETVPDPYFLQGEWHEDGFVQKASKPNLVTKKFSSYVLHPDWTIVQFPTMTVQERRDTVYYDTQITTIPKDALAGEYRLRLSILLLPVDKDGCVCGRLAQLNLHNYSATTFRKRFYTMLEEASKKYLPDTDCLLNPFHFVLNFPFEFVQVGDSGYECHAITPTIVSNTNINSVKKALQSGLDTYQVKTAYLTLPEDLEAYFNGQPDDEAPTHTHQDYETLPNPNKK